ncbi:MAG: AraC family transcriptional regulator [Candidatus Cryptobacteroides sp.]
MRYSDIISALTTTYLSGGYHKVTVGDRFCMVDNLDGGPGGEQSDRRKIRFPIKITMSFCIYCHSGKMSLRVQQQDYVVGSGQMLVIFAGQIVERASVEGPLAVVFLSVDSEFIMTQVRSRQRNKLRGFILRSTEPTLLHPDTSDAESFESLCRVLRQILKNVDRDYAEGLLSGFITIFGSLLACWFNDAPQSVRSTAETVLMRFQSDVHNFSSRFKKVSYYAARQRLSSRHFSRLIKEVSGRDPKDLIKEYVVLEAKSLLQSGNYSVREVADLLGFENDSFFNRYFKSAAGVTPGVYSQNN